MQLKKFIGVGLAVSIPALAVAQLEGLRLDFQTGEPIKAADINSNFSKLAEEVTVLRQQVQDLQQAAQNNVVLIAGNLTLRVPEDFPTPHAALTSLANRRISPQATVTVSISGEHSNLPPLDVEHADGRRIKIVGQGASSTTLRFSGVGIRVSGAQSLGLVSGLTIEGPGGDPAGDTMIGISAENGAYVLVNSGVVVRDFDNGYMAIGGSTLAVAGTIAEDNLTGYTSISGSFVYATGTSSTGNETGYYSREFGYIVAERVTLAGPSEYGFRAQQGGYIRLESNTIQGAITTTYSPPTGAISQDGAFIF